jgi:hypothetical protein
MPSYLTPTGLQSTKRHQGNIKAAGPRGAGPALVVRARIEGAERTSDVFKRARSRFSAAMRDIMVAAGEKAVLPAIKAKFPSRRFGESLFVRRDRTTVFIGSRERGPLNRAVGWLDFGGRRPRDTKRRRGTYVIVRELDSKREYIDEVILAGLLQTFNPLETRL